MVKKGKKLCLIFGLLCLIGCKAPENRMSLSLPSDNDLILVRLQEAMDVTDPVTHDFALKLASKYPGDFNFDQVCEIYTYIKSRWKYVNDPRGSEYFAKASETIKADLSGDCDDFAIVLASVIESIGGRTRVIFAYNPEIGGHAFVELHAGKGKDCITNAGNVINKHFTPWYKKIFGMNEVPSTWYHEDTNGELWINLDWWSKYPGGEYFNGTRKMAFYPRENRYDTW